MFFLVGLVSRSFVPWLVRDYPACFGVGRFQVLKLFSVLEVVLGLGLLLVAVVLLEGANFLKILVELGLWQVEIIAGVVLFERLVEIASFEVGVVDFGLSIPEVVERLRLLVSGRALRLPELGIVAQNLLVKLKRTFAISENFVEFDLRNVKVLERGF